MVSSHGLRITTLRLCWGSTVLALIGCAITLYASRDSGARSVSHAPSNYLVWEPSSGTSTAALSAAAIVELNSMSTKLSQDLYSLARDDVMGILAGGAETCENWRRKSSQVCVDPDQCGKGWLFRRKGLLLATVFPAEKDAMERRDGASGFEAQGGMSRAGALKRVNVVGLAEGGDGKLADCNSQDLSILIRLQGPEALAERATPVSGKCAWTAQFQPRLEGVYTMDVTLLDWRGGLEYHKSMCNEVMGRYGEGSVEMDAVTSGPFYGGSEACCSLCTRAEGCVGWSASVDPSVALVDGRVCVLYSSVSGEPVEDENLAGALRSGTPRKEEAMMYLGPSMMINRKWCTERNTVVVGGDRQLIVAPAVTAQDEEAQGETVNAATLETERTLPPLCSTSSKLPREGRWVSLQDTKCDQHAKKVPFSKDWSVYNKDTFGVTQPEECFLQPARGPSPTGEMKYVQGGYVWQPVDCRYDLMNTEDRLSCFRDKNVTRFLDFGDSLISTSRMPRSALWLPTADESMWSDGKGLPQVAQGAADTGCTAGRIQYFGKSGERAYCGVEAYWQGQPDQLRRPVNSFKPDVVVANWALVHRLWHTPSEEFERYLKDLVAELDGMTEEDGNRPRFMFWLSLPFLVSEREPHCVLERALRYNEAMRGLLEPRGWIEIDWVSMTRKWGLDILDGMHHGELPTRMLAYLLMHHICHAPE